MEEREGQKKKRKEKIPTSPQPKKEEEKKDTDGAVTFIFAIWIHFCGIITAVRNIQPSFFVISILQSNYPIYCIYYRNGISRSPGYQPAAFEDCQI